MTTYLFMGNKGTGKSTAANTLFNLKCPATDSPSHVTESHCRYKHGSDWVIDTIGFDLDSRKLFQDLIETDRVCIILLLNDMRYETTKKQVADHLRCSQDKINCYWSFFFTYSNDQIKKSDIKPVSQLLDDFKNKRLKTNEVVSLARKMTQVNLTNANKRKPTETLSQEEIRKKKFKELDFDKIPHILKCLKQNNDFHGLEEAINSMNKQKVEENRRKGDTLIRLFSLLQKLDNTILEYMMSNSFMSRFLKHICEMSKVDINKIETLMKSSTETNKISTFSELSLSSSSSNNSAPLSDESFADFFEALYFSMFFELRSPCFYYINDQMISYAKFNHQVYK